MTVGRQDCQQLAGMTPDGGGCEILTIAIRATPVFSCTGRRENTRLTMRELEKKSPRLRTWSDWLIDQNRHLALTEYYISSSTLDNDECFQDSVACTKFLVSMLSSRTLAQANSGL